MKPVFEAALDFEPRAKARCPACQLQLCKSRFERPHGGLKETERDQVNNSAQFSCDSCGILLVWSGDMRKPGWSQAR
jgi:uncharacterized protein with PIN domain